MTRDQALSEVRRLMQAHGLAVDDIKESAVSATEKKGSHLQTLLAYIGAAFVLGGIGTYMSIVWDDLTSFVRVVLSLGSGMSVYAVALLALRDPRLQRAVTPLLCIGAFLETSGLFVYLVEYSTGGNVYLGQMLVFAVMTAQLALSFWVVERTSLAFLSILGFMGVAQAGMNYLDFDGDWIAAILGSSGLALSWAIDKTVHRSMTPFGYFVSSAAVAIASFELLDVSYSHNEIGVDIFLLLVSAGLVALSIAAKSKTVLFVGITHLLFTLGYYTTHYFKDVVGWPIALIVMGIVLIGASAFAIRLGSGFALEKTKAA